MIGTYAKRAYKFLVRIQTHDVVNWGCRQCASTAWLSRVVDKWSLRGVLLSALSGACLINKETLRDVLWH